MAWADVGKLVEVGEQMIAQHLITWIGKNGGAIAWTLERDFQDVPHFGFWTISHHHHAIGEENRFIDIVSDHQGGEFISAPQI